MKEKLTSRKFWMALAAFLASIGASITGFVTDHEVVAWIGVICTVLSSAIYAAAEAYVDGKREEASTTDTSTLISAESKSNELVHSLLGEIGGTD